MRAFHAATLVAAAMVLAAVAAAHDRAVAQAKDGPRVVERRLRGSATFHGEYAMTLTYPRRLFARRYAENGLSGGLYGVVFSNLSRVARVRDLLYGAFPPRGVAVVLPNSWSGVRRDFYPSAYDTRLPLRASQLRRFPYNRDRQRRPYVQWLVAQASGAGFVILTRVGARASRRDRAAVASIIESIRFPPNRAQTFAPSGLYVLGRPARFRDVVTRLDSELPRRYRTAQPPLPLFLVRTRSGFVTLPARASLGRARRTCPLLFDRRAMQLLCRRTGTRWNLAGRVVSPRGAPADWSLFRIRAPVSWDGYILVVLHQTAPPR